VNSSLESVAFLTPTGNVVVEVMNRGDSAVSFKLFDADEQKAVKVTALKHSIQTFVL
jgi:O-glycosyl hydrolase